jgi:hypothetical protein
MLRRVLQAFEETDGPVKLADLSRELGVEPGALEGMVDFWVRKGRIQASGQGSEFFACTAAGCSTCGDADSCPLVAKMPRMYTATQNQPHGTNPPGAYV